VRIARADLGPDAMIELDQELITSLECPPAITVEQIRAVERGQLRGGHCPTCGILRESTLTHVITGEELSCTARFPASASPLYISCAPTTARNIASTN